MGGKGRKRREKNYRAAHGEKNRLLPPLVSSSLEALPSKPRQILKFTRPHPQPQPRPPVEEEVQDPHQNVFEGFVETNGHDEIGAVDDANEKRKKKRKRKAVKDLRFEMEVLTGISTKRKESKKKLASVTP